MYRQPVARAVLMESAMKLDALAEYLGIVFVYTTKAMKCVKDPSKEENAS